MTLKLSIRRARAAVSRYALVHAVPNERDIQMNLKQWCVLSVLVCALSGTGATSAADLRVNGQIRSAGACSIALGNGGVIDFGNLSRKDFSGYAVTREMPLTINCQNLTKLGIDVIDNRKGTASTDYPWEFGLGNRAIGSYNIANLSSPQVDGAAGFAIWRWKGETTWREKGTAYSLGSNKTMSWDVSGPQSEPVAFKTLTDTLTIWLGIERDSAFTDEFKLDGSATLELVYL
ncbi:DUF1120 domain-containing protein [Burkholderia cepacia]|uniref:DUF1120 domain-containing protein n=1 Tax=Burkholderia cepacia TaxID=292 RepID=UPI00163AC632|nr:DUF1120 domain-containing protein [Burkholderia cepacia]MCA7933682.1 DUF1120 domain-containing protein [Burkholderia cepacia]